MRAPASCAPLRKLRELHHRHAELRVRAGGAHVRVVAAADAGVDAHEDLVPAEQLRPGGECVGVVDGDAHAAARAPRRTRRAARSSACRECAAARSAGTARAPARPRRATRTRTRYPRRAARAAPPDAGWPSWSNARARSSSRSAARAPPRVPLPGRRRRPRPAQRARPAAAVRLRRHHGSSPAPCAGGLREQLLPGRARAPGRRAPDGSAARAAARPGGRPGSHPPRR